MLAALDRIGGPFDSVASVRARMKESGLRRAATAGRIFYAIAVGQQRQATGGDGLLRLRVVLAKLLEVDMR
ncbi:hypothetical protein [Mesorhizobium sp.]|uniref:hypothetical protein n=1 Tax=Mesorhizobium sp. TaxID=1871066 RepID=UPI0025DFFB6D|nr:hypothetical protein [Mesorhizobium sp.]